MNNLLKSRIPVQSLLKSGGFNPSGTDGASGAKSLTSIRFEAGKVIMKSSTILTPETAPFAAKMNSRPLNIDLVASIPKGNLLALIDFHFDPTVIADILDKAGLRAKTDSFLTAQNLPLDTLTRAFKGDFQLAVMEPEMVEGAKSPKVPIYFVTSINDLSAFSKISSTIKAKKDAAASDSSAGASRNPFAKMKFASTRQGNILVLSSAKEYTDGWFSNTEKRNTAFVTDRIKDNPFSMLIDFKTLTHFIDGLMKDKTSAGKEKKMLDLIHGLDRMTIASGGLRDGKSEAYIELQLTDTSTNSLVQLYRILHQ
jgi:Domain of unknown function (DUF4836)